MTRRLKVPYSLARKRIRASLNKYNVYNALTWRKNRPLSTQYRQVFLAKQETRAYHGDRLTENQFKNHFRGELPVVSPLTSTRTDQPDIPYAMQTFVGLEKRLDFAVFRSLFASSVRQAASFILRGSVKVNGVRIRSPGYVLRPGDMFSVDPRRVLFALGRPKPSKDEAVKLTNNIIKKFNNYIDRCHANPEAMWKRREKSRRRHLVHNRRFESRKTLRADRVNNELQHAMNQQIKQIKPASILESVLKGTYKPEKKVEGVIGELKRLLPTADASATEEEPTVNSLGSAGKRLLAELADHEKAKVGESFRGRMIHLGEPEPYDPNWLSRLPAKLPLLDASQIEDVNTVNTVMPFSTNGGKLYGLAEPKKQWFTPWMPRQFLAPFAVLPHHIEIDFETCHAVYLREPVARPGHSEIISPFGLDLHERAYLWYIYRRRKNLPCI